MSAEDSEQKPAWCVYFALLPWTQQSIFNSHDLMFAAGQLVTRNMNTKRTFCVHIWESAIQSAALDELVMLDFLLFRSFSLRTRLGLDAKGGV